MNRAAAAGAKEAADGFRGFAVHITGPSGRRTTVKTVAAGSAALIIHHDAAVG